jgi:uncharacterized membrane-anchored protein YhcB (DUF1043 family)
MNLMPESTLRWQSFNQKKPYFVFTLLSMVAVLFAIGFLFNKLAANKEREKNKLQPEVDRIQHKVDLFKKAYGSLQKSQADAAQLSTWMQQRFYWGDFMADMRRALVRSEDSIKKKYSVQKPGIEAGVWIEQMIFAPGIGGVGGAASAGMPTPTMQPAGVIIPGYNAPMPGEGGMAAQPTAQPVVDANGMPVVANTNIVTLVCRSVDLSKISGDASANLAIANAVEGEIKNSPLVIVKDTSLTGNIVLDEANGTFTFTVNVAPTNFPSFNSTPAVMPAAN